MEAIQLPPVDPEHPLAAKYQLIATLVQDHGEQSPIKLLWEMLDDTPFMIEVFRAIWRSEDSPSVLMDYCTTWYERGYRNLVFACLEDISLLRITFAGHVLATDDLEMFQNCASKLDGGEVGLVLKYAFDNKNDAAIEWLAQQYRDLPITKATIRKHLHAVKSSELWDTLRGMFSIPITEKMIIMMSRALFIHCYRTNQITPRQVLAEIIQNVDRVTDSNLEEIRALVQPYQLEIQFALYQSFSKELNVDRPKRLIQLVEDIHAEDEWLFWNIARTAQECPTPHSTIAKQCLIVLKWISANYQLDLFTRGLAQIQACSMTFEIIHHHSIGTYAQFWYHKDRWINCVVSAHSLPEMTQCRIYRVDHLYLYTKTMRFDPDLLCFLDCSEETINRRVSLSDHSKKTVLNQHLDENDGSHSSSIQFTIVDLAQPELEYLGYLPDFLLPITKSGWTRAKSACQQ